MAQTGTPSFPSGPKFSESNRKFPDSPARPVDILSLPPALRESRGPQHIVGDVLEGARAGTVRVRTAHGDVEIRASARVSGLEAGHQVEIEIPPADSGGTFPVRGLVRPAPAPAPVSAPALPDLPGYAAAPAPARPESPPPAPAPAASGPYETSSDRFALPAVRFVFLPVARLAESLAPAAADPALLQTLAAPLDQVDPALSTPWSDLILSTTASATLSALVKGDAHSPPALPDTQDILLARPAPPFVTLAKSLLSPIGLLGSSSEPSAASHTPGAFSAAGLFAFPASGQPPESVGSLHVLLTPQGSLVAQAAPTLESGAVRSAESLDAVLLRAESSSALIGDPSSFPSGALAPFFKDGALKADRASLLLSAVFAGQVTGTVVGKTPAGLPVLSLDLPGADWPELVVMQTAPSTGLGAGAALTLAPLSLGKGVSSVPVSAEGLALPLSALPFPAAFEEMWQSLVHAAPTLAAAAAKILPTIQNPAALGPAVLLFLSAARTGDLGGWLGEKGVEALRRSGKGDGALRAGRDFSNLLAASEREGGWKSLPLPMVWDGQIHRIALHWREGGKEGKDPQDDQPSAPAGARFVLDLDFNRLGPAQVDGLMRGTRLDIALRTTAPLSAAMRYTLGERFSACLALSGLSGELHFQTDPESWFRIKMQVPRQNAWA